MPKREGLARHLEGARRAATDKAFYGALALGLVALALPLAGFADVDSPVSLPRLVLKALAEEVFFRAALQGLVLQWAWGRRTIVGLTAANWAVSALFAALHLALRPGPMAAATLFPSLVFGWTWDRYKSLVPCWLVHLFYNLCLFYGHEAFFLAS